MEIEGLARAKFRLVEAFVRVIAKHRAIREATAFERALFPQSGLEFETSSAVELVFDEDGNAYNQLYKGGTEFKKHLFRVVGDLDASGEEFDCAVYLERCKDVKAWVRNTCGNQCVLDANIVGQVLSGFHRAVEQWARACGGV